MADASIPFPDPGRIAAVPSPADPPPGALWCIPLGGLGEIGRNMLALHWGSDIIVIDAGLMFPTRDMLGIDIVIPDVSYLLEHKENVRAIFLTHGHEDHIGALPYILPLLQVPVYGTGFTLGLVRSKLGEFRMIQDADLRPLTPGEPVEAGPFLVEAFPVVHSIPDGVGLAVHTPLGAVIHTGDFKIDQSPIDGRTTDLLRLGQLGQEGVLLLLSDSTNAEKPGYSTSELLVGETLRTLMGRARGRIITSSFASSIHRIQHIVNAADALGRSVCFVGRSMVSTVAIARETGHLLVPPGLDLPIERIGDLPDHKQVIITTGSQGEPMSALSLMATNNHKWVEIHRGDTVILSSTPVPGNERLVSNIINLLFRLGAEVIYNATPKSGVSPEGMPVIHSSGHPNREDLKLVFNLTKPRFFVPVHGEYRHLVHHAHLAVEMGVDEDRVFILEDGEVLEITKEEGMVVGRVPAGDVLVDGLSVGEVGPVVLRDRHHLAQDGICLVVASIDRSTGEVLAGPEIISRGFSPVSESDALFSEARELAMEVLSREAAQMLVESSAVREQVRISVRKLLQSRTGRRPMVIPVIMEV